MSEGEEWRAIPRFDGKMEASSLGRIRSKTYANGKERNDGQWRVCKLTPQSKGYLTVSFHKKNYLVSNLVLEAFVGPKPDGYEAAHFPDPTKTNNAVSNLRWAPPSENSQDKVLQIRVKGQVLTPEEAWEIKKIVKGQSLTHQAISEIQRQWPQATPTMIKHIRSGNCWGWLEDRMQ